mmetsp:Transcript_16677/g.63181  ORF Transcript_16677/g.63181 Transcript_16677/m.63181 type:complete len:89 (+) Transcript_16677:82-348(+)
MSSGFDSRVTPFLPFYPVPWSPLVDCSGGREELQREKLFVMFSNASHDGWLAASPLVLSYRFTPPFGAFAFLCLFEMHSTPKSTPSSS